jgi:hypothetical protein
MREIKVLLINDSALNGKLTLKRLVLLNPDIGTLHIEMPEMDGR